MPSRRALPLRRRLALLLALACLGADPDEPRPIAVVVSARWPDVAEIELPVLRTAFLGRRTSWAGMRIRCLNLAAGHPVREAWSRRVLGASDAGLEGYWIEQALSGGSQPPAEVASTAAMLARVAAEPGAIGYVDYGELLAAQAPDVRVLAVRRDDRAWVPSESGYPIVWRPAPPRGGAP
jgi:ABC-type phosphate transport system substrate-binding protein